MITLPAKTTDEGTETRVLLAECRGPSYGSYSLSVATTCMQLMDLVLWHRVANPRPFGARGHSLQAVIKARGQFAGFENYPNYDSAIVARIQAMINIANNSRDARSQDFADFINAAIGVSNAPTIPDPSAGTLVSWRTAGSSSPGSGFTLYNTVLGIDFYFM